MLAIGLMTLCTISFGQETENQNSVTIEMTDSDLFQSIRPADGSPVVFNSQEELDNKIADKVYKIKVQLVENQNDAEKVIYLKKELWRFENAIVKTKNS